MRDGIAFVRDLALAVIFLLLLPVMWLAWLYLNARHRGRPVDYLHIAKRAIAL